MLPDARTLKVASRDIGRARLCCWRDEMVARAWPHAESSTWLSLAGGRFLGDFGVVEPKRTAMFSSESGMAMIQKTALGTSKAAGSRWATPAHLRCWESQPFC